MSATDVIVIVIVVVVLAVVAALAVRVAVSRHDTLRLPRDETGTRGQTAPRSAEPGVTAVPPGPVRGLEHAASSAKRTDALSS